MIRSRGFQWLFAAFLLAVLMSGCTGDPVASETCSFINGVKVCP